MTDAAPIVAGEFAVVSRHSPIVFTEQPTTHLVDGRDAPLFDEGGKPTTLTQNALQFCRDYQGQHLAATEFAEALRKANLLVENRADVTLKDGQTLSLSGFKVIDDARFNQLPDEELLAWRRKGWQPLVYAHFFSVGNWAGLVDRTAGIKAAA